jgi:Porphobilinogen deaminase, dipyromethane cofactor binding domain
VVKFKARSVMTDGDVGDDRWDKDRKSPLRNLGGGEGGVFTTRLEQELLSGNVDIAVHSRVGATNKRVGATEKPGRKRLGFAFPPRAPSAWE